MSPKTPSDAAFVLYVWLINLQKRKKSPNDEIIKEIHSGKQIVVKNKNTLENYNFEKNIPLSQSKRDKKSKLSQWKSIEVFIDGKLENFFQKNIKMKFFFLKFFLKFFSKNFFLKFFFLKIFSKIFSKNFFLKFFFLKIFSKIFFWNFFFWKKLRSQWKNRTQLKHNGRTLQLSPMGNVSKIKNNNEKCQEMSRTLTNPNSSGENIFK